MTNLFNSVIKNICIITSGQPSANPRAVKEALLLSKKGFKVKVIYCLLSPWADEFDKKLFKENPSIIWIATGYHPIKNKVGYWYARLRKKGWQMLGKFIQNKFDSNIKSSVLFYQELLKESLKHKADLYIGHNLGALAVVAKVAKKYKARAGFDAEDFHRGESSKIDKQNKVTESIENRYFPLMDYCTVASPLIGEAYKKIFPAQSFTVINNVFSKKYLKDGNAGTDKEDITLNLFWFSQFIGPKRGLEIVILALQKCKNFNIKLHLLGNIDETYKNLLLEILDDKTKIEFVSPVPPEKIFKIASQYDVGLATEIPHTDNRDFCLTNKIFTYLISGNALIISNTQAQTNFIKKHPNIGMLYNFDSIEELSGLFKSLCNDHKKLNDMKANALLLAKSTMNWEYEGEVFLDLMKSTLKN